MARERVERALRAVADWWSFQRGTIESWFDREPDPIFEELAAEKDRLQRVFPNVDIDGKRPTRQRQRKLRRIFSSNDTPD